MIVGGERGLNIDEIYGVYDSKKKANNQYRILEESIEYPEYELWIEKQTLNSKYRTTGEKK